MYYIYGVSRPSLLIESTDSMIIIMSVLSHSLSESGLTDESIPHLIELIESARNLEKLNLQ